jgi:hypothetical protein
MSRLSGKVDAVDGLMAATAINRLFTGGNPSCW